jgi:hypothetical protein
MLGTPPTKELLSDSCGDLRYQTQILDWVKGFLGKPHPQLGRPGVVCPFVPRALQLKTVQTRVVRTQGLSEGQIEALVKDCRNHFLAMEPQQGELAIYKAFMLIFPDISTPEETALIDRVQQRLKLFFVAEGLMIGEFHQYNESPGLHNPDFRPLRSPIPMLAIRFMAESDLPFLSRLSDQPEVRVHYLTAYLRQMANIVKDPKALGPAQAALELAQAQLTVATLPTAQAMNSAPVESAVTASRCPLMRVARLLRSTFCV